MPHAQPGAEADTRREAGWPCPVADRQVRRMTLLGDRTTATSFGARCATGSQPPPMRTGAACPGLRDRPYLFKSRRFALVVRTTRERAEKNLSSARNNSKLIVSVTQQARVLVEREAIVVSGSVQAALTGPTLVFFALGTTVATLELSPWTVIVSGADSPSPCPCGCWHVDTTVWGPSSPPASGHPSHSSSVINGVPPASSQR